MTRARSLSLLANSNIFTVDQSNSRVGIGSTIPDVKLDVDGNMNVSGTLTYEDVTNVETAGITTTGGLVVTGLGATIGGITTFFGDLNFGAAGVGGTVTTLGHAEFAGIVTATSFSGDGSGLTGVASTDNINTSTLAQFTGGVGIADSIFHIDDSNTAIRFPASDTFTVETAGTERLRITSAGKIGIGNVDPNAELSVNNASSNASVEITRGSSGAEYGYRIFGADGATSTALKFIPVSNGTLGSEVARFDASGRLLLGTTTEGFNNADNFTVADSGNAGITIRSGSTSLGALAFSDATSGTGEYDGYVQYDQNTQSLRLGTAAAEKLRIDSGGRVLIGHTDPAENNNMFEVSTTYGGRIGFLRNDTTTSAGNNLGMLSFYGNDSNGTYQESARIQVDADLDHATGDKPGRITFLTSPDGSNTVAERLRIDSSGAIGVGGANFGSSGQVLTSNGSGSAVTWEDASGGGGITTQVGNASGIVTSMFLTDATDHKVTATGICTITTTQAGTEGQSHTIRIVNSGIATVGFSTYFLFPSGSSPVLPTTSGAVSLISFTVHDSVGAGCTQLLAGASVNFS